MIAMTIEEIKAEISETKQKGLSRTSVNDLAVLMYVYNNWELGKKSNMIELSSICSDTIHFESDSEFGKLINGKDTSSVLSVIQEIVDALMLYNPELYNAVIRRLKQL